MAKTVIVRAICDRCNTEGQEGVESVEEVHFSYDGYSYGLDLCASHASEFHNTLQGLISASTDRTRVAASRRTQTASASEGSAAMSSHSSSVMSPWTVRQVKLFATGPESTIYTLSPPAT